MGPARRPAALLAAFALLSSSSPLAARERFVPIQPRPVIEVVVTGDDVCPEGRAEDILVCGMRSMGPAQLRILHRFSQCVAQRRPGAARDILARGYDAAMRPALGRIAAWGLDCGPGGHLHVSGMLFAGAMAEALLVPLTRGASLERVVAFDPDRPSLDARDEAEMMSFCAVRAAPAAVAALFATDGASRREEAAVQALLPQLTECLGRDVRLVTNRPALRALLALAALRLALNNHAAPARASMRGDKG
ncbi:MAG: hypothetical protein QOH81_2991 [Sphingomonadales bacterium]|nr:hypothetical protein [Sphingomonadales bacterium]